MAATHRCACAGVAVGSYDNQVVVEPTIALRRNTPERELARSICLDRCLAAEVQALWACRVRTTGCCCGHNQVPAYIGVEPDDAWRMTALGYRVVPNPIWPDDRSSFSPLSLDRVDG